MKLRIKDLREDNDHTQEFVSRYLLCDQSLYSKYERGEREIPLQLIIKLAKLYHVSVDYLVGLTDIPEAYDRQVTRSDNLEKYVNVIGRNVAYYREKKQLTQASLAMQVNTSPAYISHIEAESIDSVPSLYILLQICTKLEIEPHQLFIDRKIKK